MKPSPVRRVRRRWRRISRRTFAVLLALAVALIPIAAFAAQMMSGDSVVISAPINDDVYVFGSNVRIDADINGDVIASAAEITINGHVTGSVYAVGFKIRINGNVDGVVMASGSDVRISGDVGRSVRVVASSLKINGSVVGDDVVAVATTLVLDADSSAGGDVVVRGSNVKIDGDIGGEIRGNAGSIEIGGTVGGPIDVHVGTLRFTQGAVISQPVRYTSDREVLVDGGTDITGELTRVPPHHASFQNRVVTSLLWAIFRFAWAFVLGIFLLRIAPQLVLRTSEIARRRPFPSLGWGFLGIFVIPLLIAFLMITVVGIPVALVLLGGFILALYASQIVLAMTIGLVIAPHGWRTMGRLRHAVGVLACGLAVVVVVRSLPIPGWTFIISAAIAMVGLGALVVQILGRDRERPKDTGVVRT